MKKGLLMQPLYFSILALHSYYFVSCCRSIILIDGLRNWGKKEILTAKSAKGTRKEKILKPRTAPTPRTKIIKINGISEIAKLSEME